MTLLLLALVHTPAHAQEAPSGHATIEDGRLTLHNDSGVALSSVVAIGDNGIVCTLGTLQPHDQAGINIVNCTGSQGAAPARQFQVASAQGAFTAAVVAPAAPAPDKAAASDKSAPPSKGGGGLKVGSSLSGGFGPARRLTIRNDGTAAWTGCTVTVNDLYSYPMKNLSPGADEGIMMVRFKDAQGNTFVTNNQIKEVKVKCDQGTGVTVPP